jgi:hypothetical protein
MTSSTFLDFYKSDLQSVYALCVVPLLFLAYLLLSPVARATARSDDAWRRFLYGYCVVFALETMLDPIATGPLTRWLGVGEAGLGTAILLTFVLLGDFRVYLLMFRLARFERPLARVLLESAGWTLVVPVFAYAVDSALHLLRPALPEQTIWLVYELAFLGIAIWLRVVGIARRVPAADATLRRGLEGVAVYAAGYYALWATADVIILVAGLDVGWALRVIPNQLYYAFYIPFVYVQLSSRR